MGVLVRIISYLIESYRQQRLHKYKHSTGSTELKVKPLAPRVQMISQVTGTT